METSRTKNKSKKGIALILSVVLVFCVWGGVVFSISRKVTNEMAESAIYNLSASLDLLQGTIRCNSE